MELSQAISQAIKEFGKDIISESRFVNILADCDAFAQARVLRTIIRDMVDQGFTRKIIFREYDVKHADEVTKGLVYEALNQFPYREELVQTVVSAFVYSIVGIGNQTKKSRKKSTKTISKELVPNPLSDFVISDDGKTLLKSKAHLSGVVAIPCGIVFIGKKAFENNKLISKVIIPEGVITIFESAFSGCEELEAVHLPKSLKNIENYAFSYCTKLIKVSLSENLEKLGYLAFGHCDMLKNISIKSKLMSINSISFDCACTCSKNNKWFCAVEGALYSKDMKTLYRIPCDSEQYIMPDSVETIWTFAISNCSKLKHLSFSKNLKHIRYRAIERNALITDINLPSSVKKIDAGNFDNLYNLKEIHLPVAKAKLSDENSPFPPSLRAIFVDSLNPYVYGITVSSNLFCNLYDNCLLYVPKGSLKKYKAHPVFGCFKHIEERIVFSFDRKMLPNAYRTKYDFCHIDDVVLGETTWEEAEQKGYKVRVISGDDSIFEEKYPDSRVFNGKNGDFWDHEEIGCFTHYYWTVAEDASIPRQWENCGLFAHLSYDKFISLFRKMGFCISIEKSPVVEFWNGRNSLSAKFTAVSYDLSISFTLEFCYGNEKGDGATTGSSNSLYSITVQV